MASIKLRTIACTAGLLLSGIGAAQAQAPDQMKMVYEAARNQLGVLQYCSDKGMADSSAVDTQKKMLTMLPPPADTSASSPPFNGVATPSAPTSSTLDAD